MGENSKRDMYSFQGSKELENLKKHAINSLEKDETAFIKLMDKKVMTYANKKSDEFLTLDEIVKLKSLWKKYHHLMPIVFSFDPKETIPEIFKDQIAFIVWTIWRYSHLVCKKDLEDLKKAAPKVSDILSKFKPPYSSCAKKSAVREFSRLMESAGYHTEIPFFEKRIFPYLDETWKFKWELKS